MPSTSAQPIDHRERYLTLGLALAPLGISGLIFADLTWIRVLVGTFFFLLGIAFVLRALKANWFLVASSEKVRIDSSNVLTKYQSPPRTRWGSWALVAIAILALSTVAAFVHYQVFAGERSQPVIAVALIKQIVHDEWAKDRPGTAPASASSGAAASNDSSTNSHPYQPLDRPMKERAHIRIEEPKLDLSELKVGAKLSSSVYCRNITSVNIPAREVFCASRFAVVVTDSNGDVSVKDQEEGFSDFEKSLDTIRPKKGEGPTIFPPEAQYGIGQVILPDRAVELLRERRGTVISFALVSFKDDLGQHLTESCFWLMSPIMEQNRVWKTCQVHSGIRY